jgi:adenylylsulfate reductase subunit A
VGLSIVNVEHVETDLVIVGGGAAGLMAAIRAREIDPAARVTVLEKAHVDRSGCLAMGLNAINLHLGDGRPEEYVDYVLRDNAGIARPDLLGSLAHRVDAMVERLDAWGVPFPKRDGGYVRRSSRSIAMHGEQLKPILARQARAAGAAIRNHTPVYELLIGDDGGVDGVVGFELRTGRLVAVRARATLIATGGASGIYKPTSPGTARKKTWYCPYCAGGGLALGIRHGAEMTSFEMRFVALRTKDVIAPTGTMAFVRRIAQRNAQGAEYVRIKGAMLGRRLTTAERLLATVEENRAGNGPCAMDLGELSGDEYAELERSYLQMAPGLVLLLRDDPERRLRRVEVIGSEPYVNGGHGMAGYWIDVHRRTTLPRLYAAGDVAGGAPKKYVTGCFAEAEIAVEHALGSMGAVPPEPDVHAVGRRILAPLGRDRGVSPYEIEERLQKLMDEYAGGATVFYECSAGKLGIARGLLGRLEASAGRARAADRLELMDANDMLDRITVARTLVEHLLAREETRWPCYQSRADFPVRNDVEFRCFTNSIRNAGRVHCFRRELEPPFARLDPEADDGRH